MACVRRGEFQEGEDSPSGQDPGLEPPRSVMACRPGAGWRVPLACFAIALFLKLGVSLAAMTFPMGGGGPGLGVHSRWMEIWCGVNTDLYLQIASMGYPSLDSGAESVLGLPIHYAFFPGYAMAIRLLWFLGSPATAGLLVSTASLLLASVVLFRLVSLDHGPAVARWCVICLYVFPSAFVLSDVMSESLFLLLTVGCAYQCRLRRWGPAVCLGFLAALTRPFGVLTAVLIAGERYGGGCPGARGWTKSALLAAAPVGGMLLYGLFNWMTTGEFFAFVRVQAMCQRHLSDPFTPLVGAMTGTLQASMAGGLSLFSLALLFLTRGKVRRSYWWFGLACVLAPLMTGSVLSMGRFLAVTWPVPMALALVMEESGVIGRLLVGFLVLVQILLLWMRACGAYGPVV